MYGATRSEVDREFLTEIDILEQPIDSKKRLELVLRREFFDRAIWTEVAFRAAERALRRERDSGREPDARSLAAIDAARKFVRDEIDLKSMMRAYYAASDAADASSRDEIESSECATFAAESAAKAAFRADDPCVRAVVAAIYYATAYAFDDLVAEAERQAQISDLLELFRERREAEA